MLFYVALTLWNVHHSNSDARDKITNEVITPLVLRKPLCYWNHFL